MVEHRKLAHPNQPHTGATRPYPTTPLVGDSGMGFSRFARSYSGNTSWYLFLRLLICLSSAGSRGLTRSEFLRAPTRRLSSMRTAANAASGHTGSSAPKRGSQRSHAAHTGHGTAGSPRLPRLTTERTAHHDRARTQGPHSSAV